MTEETSGIHPMHKPPEKMGPLARDMIEFLVHRGLHIFLLSAPVVIIKSKPYVTIARKMRCFSDFAAFVEAQESRVGLYDVVPLESVEGSGGLCVRYIVEGTASPYEFPEDAQEKEREELTSRILAKLNEAFPDHRITVCPRNALMFDDHLLWCRWSPEAAQDISEIHGVDGETELIRALIDEIRKEVAAAETSN